MFDPIDTAARLICAVNPNLSAVGNRAVAAYSETTSSSAPAYTRSLFGLRGHTMAAPRPPRTIIRSRVGSFHCHPPPAPSPSSGQAVERSSGPAVQPSSGPAVQPSSVQGELARKRMNVVADARGDVLVLGRRENPVDQAGDPNHLALAHAARGHRRRADADT